MLDFFTKLFAVDFMPHVYCLRLAEVIWLHIASDGLIAIAYFLIPIAIAQLIRRRKDLEFSGLGAPFLSMRFPSLMNWKRLSNGSVSTTTLPTIEFAKLTLAPQNRRRNKPARQKASFSLI